MELTSDKTLVLTKPGPGTLEVRLATAMTGGISLAIWMGGVARELNLLQQASDQRETLTDENVLTAARREALEPGDPCPTDQVRALYLRLLQLLDVSVEVDVLAGTSAGGINAAVLGYARANNADLGTLRNMWVNLGSFEKLLRDPGVDEPVSLLRGDEFLLTELHKYIDNMPSRPGRLRPLQPTSVFITTTLLEGEASRFTDAFGTLVKDVDHRGLFRFDERQLTDEQAAAALACAGRSSASYPVAFEPGFVSPVELGGRPAMEQYANITRPHWVADGGILMNRPINPLLREIFARPASRQVRRVLLYVIPQSGEKPTAEVDPLDPEKPPPLARALMKEALAMMQQSIAADLRAFREHNDRVDALVNTRLRMAELAVRLRKEVSARQSTEPARDPDEAGDPQHRLLDKSMLSDYVERETEWTVRPVVAALMRKVASIVPSPGAWTADLAPGGEIEQRCRDRAAAAVSPGMDALDLSKGQPLETIATYGVATFDGARATAIALLRSAFVLADADLRDALATALKAVHMAIAFERPDLRRAVEEATAETGREKSLEVLSAEIATTYRDQHRPAEGPTLSSAWSNLARALETVRPKLEILIEREDKRDMTASARSPARERAADELGTYHAYLWPAKDEVALAVALFDLHVATRSVLPVGVEIEQPVELVQVSADTATALSRRGTAQEKLTGMQLHHFGAFYKPAWRANDWAWGRVDGAGWLVHVLLDPRRIRTLIEQSGEADERREWLLRRLATDVLRTEPLTDVPGGVWRELEYLDNPALRQPASLPATATWLASAWQRWIAAEELPVIAKEIDCTPTSETSSQSQLWADQVRGAVHSDGYGRLLGTCPVPDERILDEFGEPLFTRTVTKAVAVAGAMLDPVRKVVPLLGPLLTTLRTITLAGHRAAQSTQGWPRPLLRVGLVAMLIGLVAAISDNVVLGLPGVAALLLGGYLVAIATWGPAPEPSGQPVGPAPPGRPADGPNRVASWIKLQAWRLRMALHAARSIWNDRPRRRNLLAAMSGITLCCVLILVAFASREWLFGDGTCSPAKCEQESLGWVSREFVPWLGSAWWHFAVVVALAVAVVTLASVLLARRRLRRRKGGCR